MEDFSKTFRRKNKFVFELRYKPFLKLLDEKGKIIEVFHNQIESTYPNWQLINSDVVFSDNTEITKNEFVVGLKRMTVLMEDIPSFEYFYDNVFKLTKLFFVNSGISSFIRIGCRVISLYESPDKKEFDYYLQKIEDIFLKDPLKLNLSHSDLLIKINHNNGFYQIGPVKSEEPWVRQNFRDFSNEKLLPKNGIGFDIDSFGTEFNVSKLPELNKKIDSTISLTKSIEDALIKSLEL